MRRNTNMPKKLDWVKIQLRLFDLNQTFFDQLEEK